ncbi:MAG TPA: hypothetical protein VMZ91_14155 [Candidatus Paceibacterota bacterium]|nr:hypothetical protein [Candidatus Paceibacterota bacterium]
MKYIRSNEKIWHWMLSKKFFCWIFGVDYESGCYKKTGCPAF